MRPTASAGLWSLSPHSSNCLVPPSLTIAAAALELPVGIVLPERFAEDTATVTV